MSDGEPDDRSVERSRGLDRIAEELAGWGRVALLETRGRRSGRPRVAAVGFIDEPDGSMLVAAASPGTAWALNLGVDPRCRVTVGDTARRCRARQLSELDAQRAVASLILRYGTPAERLGHGPAFRLIPEPVDPDDGA